MYSERRNAIQKLERFQKEVQATVFALKAAAHALINVQASSDELLDALTQEEQSDAAALGNAALVQAVREHPTSFEDYLDG